MDANSTRFHLLLGRDDWSRCTVQDIPLADLWWGSPPGSTPLSFDSGRYELTLRPRLDLFVAGIGDNPPTIEDRRGMGVDRHGNWYWIDKDERRIRVLSAGSRRASDFWPPAGGRPCPRHGDFKDVEAGQGEGFRFSGLTVTADHYLVVGTVEPGGFLVFDLFGGGGPMHLLWPRDVPFAPFDLAACPGGGIAVLDRAHRRFWVLDRGFRLLPHEPRFKLPPVRDCGGFRALGAQSDAGSPQAELPGGVSLDRGSPQEPLDPVAIETLQDGSILILDRGGPDRFARLLRYVGAEQTDKLSTKSLYDLLEVDDRSGFVLQAYDFSVLPGNGKQAARIYVASAEGNQAFAFEVAIENGHMALSPMAEYLPMRRFGGKGLAAGATFVYYDFGERWLPLVAERRPRFDKDAVLATPPLDGEEPGCVWHRLMIDACIPSHAAVKVRSRAADDKETLPYAAWYKEPDLYLRRDGSELPCLAPRTVARASKEDGTWELLFQQARGRFLQIELTLQGDLRSTPRLRNLRAWYPRFSYLEHYLPAIYREEEGPAAFLDRFLANLEGFYTAIEDRIAAAQCLFDIRTVPPETLDWLAGWLGITLDPSFDEARRRRFIRHAMLLFQYRGTVHGVRLALQLTLDDCIREEDLVPQTGDAGRIYGIRIVEQYLTRRLPGVVLGEPLAAAGPRTVPAQPKWTPAEGGARLRERYREFLKETKSGVDEASEFTLVPPRGEKEEDEKLRNLWRQFVQAQLGFVPAAGARQREAWQRFLKKKYVSEPLLNQAHGTSHEKFEKVSLPCDWPQNIAQRNDWTAFVQDRTDILASLEHSRWQVFLARRYPSVRDLNSSYKTHWPSFNLIALPDNLPPDGPPLFDYHCFETTVRPIQEKAHRFLVFLPTLRGDGDSARIQDRLDLARRIIELEKPVHTIFDVRFFWAMFRIGEARLGLDTLLGAGSRAPELMPPFVLGRDYVGTGHITQSTPPYGDRMVLEC